jgi:hypothetical protein
MGGLPVLAEYLSRPGVPPQTAAVAPRSSTTGVLAYLPKNATAVEVFPGRLGAKEFSGTPYPAGSKPAGVILTGVNGDSAPDLLVLDAGSGAAAGGVYASAAPFSAYGFRLARRGGGLQRGGALDLAVAIQNADRSYSAVTLLNHGAGGFRPGATP